LAGQSGEEEAGQMGPVAYHALVVVLSSRT